ncbi:bromodomain-containing protein DDB_G0270170 isoform X1 [Musca vetustissima]|uniref:bromodomain-containing protein DDB_G0270170 isoform X1 n=1 Tax=Musca vetustissima TaxID=27455 RepID=UPI002AB64AE5|nr:bromodomain-containing protein DDB_G0270170 isoform X1 [Musca vetustissima]
MSQNQSYFWQTTRHNVYLKRSAKLHMLLALMAVLTFSTICVAEIDAAKNLDDTALEMGIATKVSNDDAILVKDEQFDIGNDLPAQDPTMETTKPKAGFLDAFTASISVILFTELGDKTFFIAAIMAMRHPRLVVFTGAITALALMTVLSVVFGVAATIIPKVYTYYISTALFAFFGLKMIYEGYFMKDTDAQEELEEVQADLRKREDEFLRTKRGSDSETKRKNSNSDKEDNDVERGAGASSSTTNATTAAAAVLSTTKNPEMQHRQRKQLSSNHSSSITSNGCEQPNKDVDSVHDADIDSGEADAFLKGNNDEHIKMSTFHSSPALSASALSNQTNQTNCDDNSSINKLRFNGTTSNGGTPQKRGASGADVLVHSSSAMANMNKSSSSNKLNGGPILNNNNSTTIINSNNNSIDNLNGTAGQSNGDLKQFGGSKKRLERDVSASLIQDPESGVVRKNTKKSAAYLTTRVLMQAFTMTFLAEWGDRSQLTTIILATTKDVYGVITGGVIGHSICTGLAVIGGRMVAAKISVRTVTIVGGIVFLGFALYALIAKPDDL